MKRIRIIVFSAAVLLACIQAITAYAYTERNLLTGKYSKEDVGQMLIRNQKWVPYPDYSDRSGWDALFGDLKGTYVKLGEQYLDYDWKVLKATDFLEYERSGARIEGPWRQNAQAVAFLLMAELAEGKGRFLDQLINGVYVFAETTTWSWSAHTGRQKSHRAIQAWDDPVFDLAAGMAANLFSCVYHFMHEEFDKVDPEISRRLRHELKVRILDPFLFNDSFSWMNRKGGTSNNWNPWCNSNALLAFMLVEDDPQRLVDGVWLSMQSVDYFLNYIKGDGACEEGASYWARATGKVFDYLDILSLATGGKIDIFDNKLIRECGEFIARSYVGDGWFVNFADAPAKGGDSNDPFMIYRYGKAIDNPIIKGFAASFYQEKLAARDGALDGYGTPVFQGSSTGAHNSMNMFPPAIMQFCSEFFCSLRGLDIRKELSAEKPSFTHPACTWYPETQFCYMTNDAGMFLATKGGHNAESHNHNDVGTVSFYIDNVPILVDAGRATYTRQTFSGDRYKIWFTQSIYHNTPAINGVAQKDGASFKAAGASFDPARMTYKADISGAYPQEASVKSWVRSCTLGKDRLVIKDNFSLSKSVSPNLVNFMTWGDVDITTPGVVRIKASGKSAVIEYDKRKFTPSLEKIELSDPALSNIWDKALYRVILTARGTQLKDSYTFTVREAD